MAKPEDAWMSEQNLSRFRRQLAETSDLPQRTLLMQLIAEEQAKLDRLLSDRKSQGRQS